jgi:glycosyltransferase involved in cell wall biosynthesis
MPAPRILILANRIPYPLHDGGALAMHAMLQGLADQGFDIHLLAMNTSRHFVDTAILPPIYGRIGFSDVNINTDIRLLHVLKNFVFSKDPNHAERFYQKAYEQNLLRLIAGFEPDCILLESIFLATYIPLIRSLTKAKVVIRLHNIEHKIWEHLATGNNYSLKRYYLKNLSDRMRNFEMAAWQHADYLLPISNDDAATLLTAGVQTPTSVVPFGITTHNSAVPSEQGDYMAHGYHLGAMDWMPNADGVKWFVEDVWPVLHRTVPQFQFTYAGRAMPPSFIRLQGNGVVNAGEVPDASLFIRDKKILIVPLLSGSGIRVKVLEAMAVHKLVISTAIGMQGITEAKPCVHYLQANNAEEFTNAISWALNNKEEAEKIARQGAALVATYYNQDYIMKSLKATLLGLVS